MLNYFQVCYDSSMCELIIMECINKFKLGVSEWDMFKQCTIN